MIEVKMTKDIRDYSPKVIGPFTGRQLVCLVISLVYGIPIMIAIPFDIIPRVLLGMLCMAPVLACGWVAPYGIPLERFFIKCIIPVLGSGGKRRYKCKNDFSYLIPPREKIKKVKRNRNIESYK